MQESTVGIKIANGTYFPIVKTGSTEKKRLVLTTVNDNQSSVQIDLYQGEGSGLQDAVYIGSLVLDNIGEGQKGEPEVEFILGIDKDGNIKASAGDLMTGEHQSLSLSLETLSEDGSFKVPEFDLDTSFDLSGDVSEYDDFDFPDKELFESEPPPFEEDFTEDSVFEEEEDVPEIVRRRKVNPALLAAFIIVGLIIIALLAFLIYRSFQGPETPPLEARQKTEIIAQAEPEPPQSSESAEAAAPAAGTQQEVQKPEQNDKQPAEQPAVKQEEKLGGVWYWIKWGDTLWDLSQSFYRTPWLYGRIAKENQIKNPDLIFANSKIFIPEF